MAQLQAGSLGLSVCRVGSMAGVADGHPGYEGCAGPESMCWSL